MVLSLLLKTILATHWPAVWRLDFWVKLIFFLFYPTPSLQRSPLSVKGLAYYMTSVISGSDFLSLLPNTFLVKSILLSLLLKTILATHWPAVWRLDFWVKLIFFLFYPTPSLQRTGQTKVALLNVCCYSEPFPRRILADVRWCSQTS